MNILTTQTKQLLTVILFIFSYTLISAQDKVTPDLVIMPDRNTSYVSTVSSFEIDLSGYTCADIVSVHFEYRLRYYSLDGLNNWEEALLDDVAATFYGIPGATISEIAPNHWQVDLDIINYPNPEGAFNCMIGGNPIVNAETMVQWPPSMNMCYQIKGRVLRAEVVTSDNAMHELGNDVDIELTSSCLEGAGEGIPTITIGRENMNETTNENTIQEADLVNLVDDVIEVQVESSEDLDVILFTSNGTIVKSTNTSIIDTSGLSAGLYFLRVKQNGNSFTEKIVLAK